MIPTKPLDWKPGYDDDRNLTHTYAATALGTMTIAIDEEDLCNPFIVKHNNEREAASRHSTLLDAKQACQDKHHKQIAAFLKPTA